MGQIMKSYKCHNNSVLNSWKKKRNDINRWVLRIVFKAMVFCHGNQLGDYFINQDEK